MGYIILKDLFPFAYRLFNDKLVKDFFKSFKWLVFGQVGALLLFFIVYNYGFLIDFLSEVEFPAVESEQGATTRMDSDPILPKPLFRILSNVLMGVAGILGIIGSVIIIDKWDDGDQDINKELMSWGGVVLFLIFGPIILSAFLY